MRLTDSEVVLTRWKAFIKKQNIHIEFGLVMEVIDLFLRDVLDSGFKGEQFKKTWNADELSWK